MVSSSDSLSVSRGFESHSRNKREKITSLLSFVFLRGLNNTDNNTDNNKKWTM